MSNTTVVNALKDRSKCMRRIREGVYEYGWMVLNRRKRDKSYFNKMGEGSMEQAEAWMNDVVYRPKRVKVFTYGPGKV